MSFQQKTAKSVTGGKIANIINKSKLIQKILARNKINLKYDKLK